MTGDLREDVTDALRARLAEATDTLIRAGWAIPRIPERPSRAWLIARLEEDERRVRTIGEGR